MSNYITFLNPELSPEGTAAQSLIRLGIDAAQAFHIISVVDTPQLPVEKCIALIIEAYPNINTLRLDEVIRGYVRHGKRGL